jgi:hypothetical protein
MNADNEDASENSEEFEERQAALQRVVLAQYAGPMGAATMQQAQAVAHRAKSDRISHMRDALGDLISKVTITASTPFVILPECEPLEHTGSTSVMTRQQARRDETVRRLGDKMLRLHAVLLAPSTQAITGTPEQRRLCRSAARPPWPPSNTATEALTMQAATASLETFIGGLVVGSVLLPSKQHLVLVLDLRLETLPLAFGAVFDIVSSTLSDAIPVYWPRSQFNTPADVRILYRQYAWLPLELAAAAAAGSGAR